MAVAKIPKEIKKDVVYKKDLKSSEIDLYNDIYNTRWSSALIVFLEADEEQQKKTGRVVSSMINNARWWYFKHFEPFGYRPGVADKHQLSNVKRYISLIKNTNLVDANKLLFLRHLFNDVYRFNPLNLPFDKAEFNDPKYSQLLKENVPRYRLRHAFNKDFTEVDIHEIIETAKAIPNTVFQYPIVVKICEAASAENLIKFFDSNPGQSSQYLALVPGDKLKVFTEETFKNLIKKNARCLKHIPDESITEEMADIAIGRSGAALFDLPKEFQTKERIEKAVSKSPSILEDLPKAEHTSTLLLKATLASPKARKYFKR